MVSAAECVQHACECDEHDGCSAAGSSSAAVGNEALEQSHTASGKRFAEVAICCPAEHLTNCCFGSVLCCFVGEPKVGDRVAGATTASGW